jgi:hypothetical protein
MDGRSVFTGELDADDLLQSVLDEELDVRRAQTRIGLVARSRKSRLGYIKKMRAQIAARIRARGPPPTPAPAISISTALQSSLERMQVRR